MPDPEVLKRYRAWRAKHPTFPIHYFVTHPKEPPFEWCDRNDRDFFEGGKYVSAWRKKTTKTALWQDETFRYVARYVYDDMPSDPIEFLGEWTDKGDFPETLKRSNVGRNEYARFTPQYAIRQRQHDYHEAGMAWGPAYERAVEEAKADLKRAEAFGDDWYMGGVIVEVYLLRDEEYEHLLGDSSVWGIESDCGDDYLTECAQDQAHEAVAEARREIERDCARSGQQHFEFFQGA